MVHFANIGMVHNSIFKLLKFRAVRIIKCTLTECDNEMNDSFWNTLDERIKKRVLF